MTRLDLSDCKIEDADEVIGSFVSCCTALEHLEVGRVWNTSIESFRAIGCADLRHLGVSGTCIDSATVVSVLTSCPRLCALDASNTSIDDAALDAIERARRSFTRLKLSGCESVTSDRLLNLL